jgi:hypothetical protein
VLHGAGSFAQWHDVRFNGKELTYGFNGEVRPVLSTQTGHADGVILIDDALQFWVGGGQVRAIPLDPHPSPYRSCRVYGGVVDRQGRLLVRCRDDGGATSIVNAKTGEMIFRAP